MRVVIVDDEPLARARVRDLLAAHPAVQIVAEAGDGPSAVQAVRTERPQVLVLDVQLPEFDGFGVLERLRDLPARPYIIFTTAFDQYALKAFEFAAVDYLLKPLDARRFDTALTRAGEAISKGIGTGADLGRLLDGLRAGVASAQRARRFAVRLGSRVRFVDPQELEFVSAEGDYVALHLGKESLLVRERMKDLEGELADHGLVRVHRSTMVNSARIREIRPNKSGEYDIVMEGGRSFPTSAAHRAEVEALMRR